MAHILFARNHPQQENITITTTTTRKLGLEPLPSRGTFSMFLEKIKHSYDGCIIIGTGGK
jgi:hypothetical protein